MQRTSLHNAVEGFAGVVQALSDAELDTEWAWGDYDSDGVRFAFFRNYEELNDLATKLAATRSAGGPPRTTAHRYLARYHAAYRDMEAALAGLTADDAELEPAEGEWPVRRVVAHIAAADSYFFALVRYALDAHRRADWQPEEIPDEAWDDLVGMDEAAMRAKLRSPLDELRRYHAALHERILEELASIDEDEIGKPSMYWEDEPMSIAFRLGRFDSHIRQHIVQIDKTLVGTGRAPNEARRLLRLNYAALAEAEGATIGAPDLGAEMIRDAAAVIAARTDEIRAVLAGP